MKKQSSNENGATLLVAMGALVLIAALVGIALTSTAHNGRMTDREQSFTRALNSADGALEYAYASWKNAVRNNGLRPPNNSQVTIAAPTSALHSGFASSAVTFSDFSVANANQWGETTDASDAIITNPVAVQLATIPGHPGWKGNGSFYSARVTASVPSRSGPVPVTLGRTFQLTGVPLFQAAIFFEHDIELHPGAQMTINGLVHTNSNLWLATSAADRLKFLSNVSYVGDYHEEFNPFMETTPPPPNPPLWSDGLPASISTTFASQLQKTERMEPFGAEPAQLFDTIDANLNNDSAREFIEPPVTSSPDPADIAGMRFYNQASVRVTIDRTKPAADPNRIVVRDGSDAALPAATNTAIRAALNVSSTPIYDWREGENVSLTNVDMKALDGALVGMGASFNGVIYIHDVTPTGKNAVRLQNGAVLSRDLSVASQNAVYIQGDYNTGGVTGAGVHDPSLVPANNAGNPTGTDSPTAPGYVKRSTAVMADAVMILSNAWVDGNSTAALAGRVADHTTVNTAILSGIVPSNDGGSGRYSGGPHNFPRFLEKWSGKDLTYLGSMVQIFNSKNFDGMFDTANIYSPPGRRWGFDTAFLTQPPPGTLQSLQYSRGRWERF
ncbi:MAG: hypothetical protein ABMA13_18710 [Chthoniobacteraceae bacterium]